MDSLLATPRTGATQFQLLIPDSGPQLAWRRVRRGVKQAIASRVFGRSPPAVHAPSAAIVSGSFAEFSDRITIQHIDIGRRALINAVKRLELDVVLPAIYPLGIDFPRPWVGYAYDFQHKYLPQYFTPDDCRSRDEHFAEMLTQAKAVIVNSRAAAADIAKFVPQATARVFALPFAPAPGGDWLEDRPDVLPQYGIAPPFFIISNQFWIHKDHATAFDAFRIVAQNDPRIALVCTGSTVDSRNPDYFPGLLARLRSWGLDRRVHILGLIPKRDQIELMKNACAVVQPTRFEGGPGGGAVYDALSLGAPVIVSDIPVCREIQSSNVLFFPAGNSVALALQMEALLVSQQARIPPAELLALGQQRRAVCGMSLWQAIDLVTAVKGAPQ